MTTADGQALVFAGMARQAQLVRDGQVSPRELVALYLERIAQLDPVLNAFRVVLAEQAMAEAARVERRLAAGEVLPLAGVPIAIKDDTDVAGVSSMCGTGIDTGLVSSDSAAMRRLRATGAVIIGKTHLPEFAAVPMCESSTWGVTRNPWDMSRTTGGSSGGSAAAVAAGMVPGVLGTDGGGSVRIPAACCGLVGLKGQRGWISTKQSPERAGADGAVRPWHQQRRHVRPAISHAPRNIGRAPVWWTPCQAACARLLHPAAPAGAVKDDFDPPTP
jgi:amidase